MRKIQFSEGEHYHVFNRGVDKRLIFMDQEDVERFKKSLELFNSIEPIGSIYEQQFRRETLAKPLVRFIAYNILANHFHLILKQITEKGISKYMTRLQAGYTYYFNNKYKRSGALFQGTFKANHIDSNEYLLYVSAYVNGNHQLGKKLGGNTSKLILAHSLNEYLYEEKGICVGKSVVLEQFDSKKAYKKFMERVLEEVRDNKARHELMELETGQSV